MNILRVVVRTAVEIRTVTPCSFMDRSSVLRGGGTCSCNLKMGTAGCSETATQICQAARHLVSEDSNVGGLLQITVLLCQ
jgi:hypothetical protein